jgi:hypothetical protein
MTYIFGTVLGTTVNTSPYPGIGTCITSNQDGSVLIAGGVSSPQQIASVPSSDFACCWYSINHGYSWTSYRNISSSYIFQPNLTVSGKRAGVYSIGYGPDNSGNNIFIVLGFITPISTMWYVPANTPSIGMINIDGVLPAYTPLFSGGGQNIYYDSLSNSWFASGFSASNTPLFYKTIAHSNPTVFANWQTITPPLSTSILSITSGSVPTSSNDLIVSGNLVQTPGSSYNLGSAKDPWTSLYTATTFTNAVQQAANQNGSLTIGSSNAFNDIITVADTGTAAYVTVGGNGGEGIFMIGSNNSTIDSNIRGTDASNGLLTLGSSAQFPTTIAMLDDGSDSSIILRSTNGVLINNIAIAPIEDGQLSLGSANVSLTNRWTNLYTTNASIINKPTSTDIANTYIASPYSNTLFGFNSPSTVADYPITMTNTSFGPSVPGDDSLTLGTQDSPWKTLWTTQVNPGNQTPVTPIYSSGVINTNGGFTIFNQTGFSGTLALVLSGSGSGGGGTGNSFVLGGGGGGAAGAYVSVNINTNGTYINLSVTGILGIQGNGGTAGQNGNAAAPSSLTITINGTPYTLPEINTNSYGDGTSNGGGGAGGQPSNFYPIPAIPFTSIIPVNGGSGGNGENGSLGGGKGGTGGVPNIDAIQIYSKGGSGATGTNSGGADGTIGYVQYTVQGVTTTNTSVTYNYQLTNGNTYISNATLASTTITSGITGQYCVSGVLLGHSSGTSTIGGGDYAILPNPGTGKNGLYSINIYSTNDLVSAPAGISSIGYWVNGYAWLSGCAYATAGTGSVAISNAAGVSLLGQLGFLNNSGNNLINMICVITQLTGPYDTYWPVP